MLNIDTCSLVVVDVQGKLAQLMAGRERLFKNLTILIRAANILDIPILCCRQYPKALGGYIDEIAPLLADIEPVDKMLFSCCTETFNQKLAELNRKQILLCGIETHVCVYQTAMDLLAKYHEVYIVADAVSSRTEENKQIALQRLAAESAKLCSVEMALFELLKTAEHPQFKEIAKLIK